MVKINISEKESNFKFIDYLRKTLNEIFRQTETKTEVFIKTSRVEMEVTATPFYYGFIYEELIDKIADVITVGYKYQFLSERINPSGLKEEEREILLTAIISADYEDDKRYVLSKLKGYETLAVDGFYNFKLKLLKEKWLEVASFMPKTFLSGQLKEFIAYLFDGRKNKIYVEGGKVYDSHYRRMIKTELIPEGRGTIVKEAILGQTGEIELLSDLPVADEKFVKEYFGGKITFLRDRNV